MINKAILVGNLGRDPEVRFTASGKAVCNFSVATSEKWTDSDGQRQESTEWHNIVVWGKQGENCGQYLSKGRPVYVEGTIKSRTYTDKEGVERRVTEIVARDVKFLGSGNGGGNREPTRSSAPASGGGGGFQNPNIDEEDLPY